MLALDTAKLDRLLYEYASGRDPRYQTGEH